MRSKVLVTMAVAAAAACSDDGGGGEVDATTDAAIDAALDGPPPIDAPPGALEGEWRVTWQCTDGCSGNPPRPSLTYSDTLLVGGDDLHWQDTDCPRCVRDHDGAAAGVTCINVDASTEGNLDRAAFQICDIGGAAQAAITWTSPWVSPPAATTWTATGVR